MIAAVLALTLAGRAEAPLSPFPKSGVCGQCAWPRSEGPAHPAHTWLTPGKGVLLGAALGLGSGAGFGRGSIEGGGASPGAAFRGGKPLVLWGGAVALGIAKLVTHDREEPPLVTEPGRRLRPPPGIDDVIRRATAARLSPKLRRSFDGLSYVALVHLVAQPLGVSLSGPHRAERWQDTLVPLEAAAVAGLAVEQVKHLVHRPRPLAYYCEPTEGADLHKSDAQLSFFSGHTTIAFALAAATSSVASTRKLPNAATLRRVNYSVAGATGLLRIMADKHYASDVLMGAAVGWLTGRELARWRAAREPSTAAPAERTTRPAQTTLSLPVGGTGLVEARIGGGFSLTVRFVR